MFIKNPEFVDFLENIEYYLSLEPDFVDMGESYPTAVIGDGEHKKITLYFNHESEIEEARAKWDKRRKRVNYENMYIMMYNLDGLTQDDIKRVEQLPKEKFRNKVLFTHTPLSDVDWSCYIEPVLTDNYPYAYLQKNLFGIRRVERHFDLIKFLNTR